ncbi:MAG: hypothetical protein M3417_03895 [Actinomycetota bacterium]|nr:hypothetical protein [Actinomycetota bacterium]
MKAQKLRELIGSLPRWARSPYALAIPLLLVVVPVVVSLLRAPHFDITFEVFPTMPPGNAGVSSDYGLALVANPGFEASAEGWEDRPACALRRSIAAAHSGSASLACVYDRGTPRDGRAASTQVVLPAPGRYRVQTWVRLPRGYNGGPPGVELEGLSGSSRVAGRAGDPRVRERWQRISSDFVVEAKDLAGQIVLRTDPPLPHGGQALYWDDVRLLSSSDVSLPAPPRVNLVANPGFEYDRRGWGDPPGFAARRSAGLAHSGSASLRSSSDRRAPSDTNAGFTYVVFPRAGTYRAQAWAYLPRNARGGQPTASLEGFSGSRQLAQQLGDPERRDSWQLVWTDYAISSEDLEGSLVLRSPPGLTRRGGIAPEAGPRPVIYWDDVSVPALRPEPPPDVLEAAKRLRSALEEPQLRFDASLMGQDTDLYDPGRATVQRSPRRGTLSFIVKVASDVPSDARSLAGPLRGALAGAARRSMLRRAQETWQELITTVGGGLQPRQRALLQRRADVLQRLIGAQPVGAVAVPSAAVPEASPATPKDPRREQRIQMERKRVISRVGSDLPPPERALVQQRADDLQRLVNADAAEFIVLPPGPLPEPTRLVDRVLDELPGPFPRRVDPVWAGIAGLICALLALGSLIATTAGRRRFAARGR